MSTAVAVAPDPGVGPTVAVLRSALRTSIGRRALWLLAALCIAHVVFRSFSWRFDWQWAITQYGYVTVLFAPLVAGVAAWDTAALSGAGATIQAAGSTRRALWLNTAAVFTWAVVAAAVGFALVAIVTVASGAGVPAVSDFSALISTSAMTAASVAVGAAVGWWLRHWSASLAITVVTFAAILGAFLSEREILSRTGGATTDLTGLTINSGWLLRQLLWFSVLTIAALEIACLRPARLTARPVLAVGAIVALVAATGTWVSSGGVAMFDSAPVRLSCVGEPPVCVTAPYLNRVDGMREQMRPALEVWAQLGVPEPQRFSQLPQAGDGFTVALPGQVLRGEQPFSSELILNGYEDWLHPDCYHRGIATRAQLGEDELSLQYWLLHTTGASAETVDPWAGLAPDARLEWAREVLGRIHEACSGL